MTFNQVSADYSTARRLSRAIITAERLHNKVEPKRKPFRPTNGSSLIVKTPDEGLPARGDEFIESAECTIQKIKVQDSGNVLEVGETVEVYNLAEVAIEGNQMVLATRDRNGKFISSSISQTAGGMFRVTFVSDFLETDINISCNVAKSDFNLDPQVIATNTMRLESDQGATGYCLLFADGTIELIAATCPAES